MSYGTDKKPLYLQAEIQVCQEHYQDLSEKVQEQQDVIRELKSEFAATEIALDQISRKIYSSN